MTGIAGDPASGNARTALVERRIVQSGNHFG